MGLLLVICLALSINYKKINEFFTQRKLTKSDYEMTGALGVYVRDFKGRVRITEVLDYTPARNAGLEPGDRILKVNGKRVSNVREFLNGIEDSDLENPISLVVHRVDSCSTFPVEVNPLVPACK